MNVFAKTWFYSVKCGCIRVKSLFLGKSGCKKAKWLYWGRRVFYSGRSSCIQSRGLYLRICGCVRAKVVVFGQKWC